MTGQNEETTENDNAVLFQLSPGIHPWLQRSVSDVVPDVVFYRGIWKPRIKLFDRLNTLSSQYSYRDDQSSRYSPIYVLSSVYMKSKQVVKQKVRVHTVSQNHQLTLKLLTLLII